MVAEFAGVEVELDEGDKGDEKFDKDGEGADVSADEDFVGEGDETAEEVGLADGLEAAEPDGEGENAGGEEREEADGPVVVKDGEENDGEEEGDDEPSVGFFLGAANDEVAHDAGEADEAA